MEFNIRNIISLEKGVLGKAGVVNDVEQAEILVTINQKHLVKFREGY